MDLVNLALQTKDYNWFKYLINTYNDIQYEMITYDVAKEKILNNEVVYISCKSNPEELKLVNSFILNIYSEYTLINDFIWSIRRYRF